MAISCKKGNFLCVLSISFLISVAIYFPRFSCIVHASDLDPSSSSDFVIQSGGENHSPLKEKDFLDYGSNPGVNLLRQQQILLENLEELVVNLNQLVSRLETQFSEISGIVQELPLLAPHDKIRGVDKIKEGAGSCKKDFSPGKGAGAGAGADAGAGAVLVTKYNTFWLDRFKLVSVVKLSSGPTCINVLPIKDFEGLSKYFAVGDDKGKVYVFLRSGDVSVEFDTKLEESSPITSMVSFLSVYKNESVIITGHENGIIVMHRIWEVLNGDEWSVLHVERVGMLEMSEGGKSRISRLEVHYVGRKRYILATDAGGRITVFRENLTVYGTATPKTQPIAFLKQRLLFLTETGAGSLDLRTMKLKESECEGLNKSLAKSYVFDATDRSKAYGLTLEGDLIQILLLGDVMNFKCRIKSKRKLDLDEPLAIQAIKGYLLIANREKVLVYNVSSHQYVRAGGLRLLFSSGFKDIIASSLNQQMAALNDEKRLMVPLITSDYEKLAIISFGNGYVAMYSSILPVFKNEFNSILWSSPVLFFIIFLFGLWHFFANKKEVLTSWGTDDPFSSSNAVSDGAPLGSGTGERSISDSSRNSDTVDIRGSSLRGPSRRYVSPSGYPGATAGSYRPGPETESRPATVDPRFRTTSELKFRGSNVETAGVLKRRESLLVNSQVVDDSK